ncbi:MAG: hypothetical protein NVSMB25_18260 [Thermoleophilaceae bacterium]
MRLRHLLPAVAAAINLAAPSLAGAADFVPGRVVVGYRAGTTHAQRLNVDRITGARYERALEGGARVVRVASGRSLGSAITALRRQPNVAYAVPDYRVHAADFIPNDPGRGGVGGWAQVQWNFIGPNSVNAPAAWDIAQRAGVPGASGVTVAVIDSGVAFENHRRFRISPDFNRSSFVSPYDFVKHDRHPDDQESHGTHVAGTIAEATNNGVGLTGLAYGAKIMPLRVLDANGDGDGASIATAIRYAVRHGARVINMSVEFDTSLRARDIPEVISAIKFATRRRVATIAASGNEGAAKIAYPARDPQVISVGATTVNGCLADYSNYAPGLTLVAPGGGRDAPLGGNAYDRANCHPDSPGRQIVQESFSRSPRNFALVGFEGTSFATPHVSAACALLIATKRLGPNPTPAQLALRLRQTARHLGAPGADRHYGAGLLDIAAALGP